MNLFSIFWYALICCIVFSSNVRCQTIYEDYHDGQIYFKLKDDQPIPQFGEYGKISPESLLAIEPVIRKYGLRTLRSPFFSTDSEILKRTFKLEFLDIDKVDLLIRDLEAMDIVEYAEKADISRVHHTPNDPFYQPNQYNWFLPKIKASNAWDYGKGSKEIVVAILDVAVLTSHPDLKDNLWTNDDEIPNNGIDDDGNGYIDDVDGWDMANNNNDPNPPQDVESWFHGTFSAGLVGATTNNNNGVASIGYNVTLLPIKAGLSSNMSLTNLWEGVTYAADNGAHIINMSFGGDKNTVTKKNAIDYAYSKGCLLVASAGNDGADKIQYPAGYTNVMAVANTDENDKKAASSNYGSWVEISAPGQNMVSTATLHAGTSHYAVASGTSSSAPLVSGLAALMWAVNPAMAAEDVRQCLNSSTDNINSLNPQYSGKLGSGRINALKAMLCVSSNVPSVDAGISEVDVNLAQCAGMVSPKVTIQNFGTAPLTSAAIKYRVGQGPEQTYQWSGNLVQFATKVVTLPVIQGDAGFTNVYARTTNPNNKNDGNSGNDEGSSIIILFDNSPRPLPWTENFDGPDFGKSKWLVLNSAGNAKWDTRAIPQTSDKALFVDNFNLSQPGETEELLSEQLDLSTATNTTVRFQLAFAQKTPSNNDRLIIRVSTNCGTSWTEVYNKVGSQLATTSRKTAEFFPSQGDWREESIDLSNFDGRKVHLLFKFTSGEGNNIYINDLTADHTMSIDENNFENKFQIVPNPSNGNFTIKTENNEDKLVQIYSITGKIIDSFRSDKASIGVNITDLKNGSYFVKVIGNGKVVSLPILIVN